MINLNKKHDGFSLLEVLISVVILSIGLLGMAGIQLKGLSSNNSANIRTQATLLANDLAERMHANPGGTSDPKDAKVNTNYVNMDFNGVNCGADPKRYCSRSSGDKPGDLAQNCDSTQMAQFDAVLWMCGLTKHDGVLDLLPIDPDIDTVTITCNDSDAGDGDNCTPGSSLQIDISWPSVSDTDGGDAITKTVSLVTVP